MSQLLSSVLDAVPSLHHQQSPKQPNVLSGSEAGTIRAAVGQEESKQTPLEPP